MATRTRLIALAAGVLTAGVAAATGAAGPGSDEPSIVATALVAPRSGAFVALWMAPPDKRLELEQFSASDGR